MIELLLQLVAVELEEVIQMLLVVMEGVQPELGESPFGDGGEGAGLDYSGGGGLLGMLMEILVIMACSGWVEMALLTHAIT